MAVITIEFLASFPRRPPMRWRWRAPADRVGPSAPSRVAFVDGGKPWRHVRVAEWTFFLPSTLVIFALGCARLAPHDRPRRAHRDRDAVVPLGLRLRSPTCSRPLFGIFEEAVWAETTFATLVSFVVIGTAVLRTELFSIRSAAAEAYDRARSR